MTVTDVALTEDPALGHLCRCSHERRRHTGRKLMGPCLDCVVDLGGGSELHRCAGFRRDVAELAAEHADEPLQVAMGRQDARRARSGKTRRARKAGRFGVGPSDIGSCRKAIQYRENPPADLVTLPEDKKAAVLGTWIHEGFTALQRSLYPWRRVKLKVLVPGFDEPGEVDSYDPVLHRVIDLKTCGDHVWDNMIAFGPRDDDVDQVSLYGLALEDAGEEVREVELVYLHRKTGAAEHFIRPYDRRRALAAAGWLHAVLESLDAGVDLPRDRGGPGVDGICDRCPFVLHCWQVAEAQLAGRSPQGYVLAHDEPEIAAALGDYLEHRQVASAAEKVKEKLRPYFDGLEAGRYADVLLSWQRATETDVPDVSEWARVLEQELKDAAAEGRPPAFPEDLPHPTRPKRTGGGIVIKRVRAAQLEAEARAAAEAS